MSDVLIGLITWLLIPAGLLPVVTMLVIRGYRDTDSPALRERWHLSIAMAAVGVATTGLAIAALTDIDLNEPFWIAFGMAVLAADIVSGKWLFDYTSGRFR